jgi:hypothetical protein
MATQVQQRRGTTAQHNVFTGANGELTVDTSKDTLVIHDGTTQGGFPLARESDIPTGALASLNSVGASQIDADAVGSTEVADNAITLAKMAHGTDGEIITYDSSGAPATVGVGTSGQVLTSNGAGSAPTMQDAGGFSSENKEGHYKNDSGVVSMYISGVWEQIFPAVYS